MTGDSHNPDVLSCLANLSNDEVFTPPKVVNDMLDLLPPELFKRKTTTFLDIGCKSGVFLREITKRLIEGLEGEIPDLQTRVDHILHNQVYGIATTELTSLVSRRTLYCSKYPNCRYSASRFETPEGNVRFRNIQHDFVGGRCKWCGASEDQFGLKVRKGLETHAYEFIHTNNPQKIFNMKFDVIVGNPPYQLSDGGFGVSASPIYQLFIQRAIKLLPRYITMIVPSRWFSGGKGLDEFRDEMLHDKRLCVIHDYPDANECFQGVQIKGGICYFLWDRNYCGDCSVTTHMYGSSGETIARPLLEKGCDTFIRYNIAVDILRKVQARNETTFERYVSSQKPYGLRTYVHGESVKKADALRLFENEGISYIARSLVTKSQDTIDSYKVFVPAAGSGSDSFPHPILGIPFVGMPGDVCTETYCTVGPFENKMSCQNVVTYIKTRFFRFLVMVRKPTQHAPAKVYSFVPIQDFSKPWSDAELYKKYKLTKDEIAFIESMIKPME